MLLLIVEAVDKKGAVPRICQKIVLTASYTMVRQNKGMCAMIEAQQKTNREVCCNPEKDEEKRKTSCPGRLL